METSNRDRRQEVAAEVLQLACAQIMAELRFFSEAAGLLTLRPDPSGPLLATDGAVLYYAPRGILQLFSAQRNAVTRGMLHSLLHCLLGHPFQRQPKTRQWWDLACDMAVEAVLCELDLPMLAVTEESEIADLCTQWITRAGSDACEKLYNHLLAHPPAEDEYRYLSKLFARDDHRLWYAAAPRQDSSGNPSARTSSLPGRQPATPSDDSSVAVHSHQDAGGEPAAALGKKWRRLSRQVVTDLETFHRQRGRQAGRLLANLKPVVWEQVDYSEFLRRFGAPTEVVHLSEDEFDIIYYTYGLTCYGNIPLIEPLETHAEQRIRTFVIAIDTSGSVQGEIVQTFLQRTCNVLRQTNTFASRVRIYLLQCDCAVQSIQELHDPGDLERIIPKMDLRGFGGTDFRPVFDTVDALIREKKLQNVDGLLYFTDGVGEYPQRQPPYKTAFIFHRDDYISPRVPSWAIRAVLTTDNIKLMKES